MTQFPSFAIDQPVGFLEVCVCTLPISCSGFFCVADGNSSVIVTLDCMFRRNCTKVKRTRKSGEVGTIDSSVASGSICKVAWIHH